MIYKTKGLIIKKRDLKDADRLLTIYAKDFGKIVVKGKAVKKSQSKLKGHLELFVLSNLMIAQGRGLDIVTNAETINDFSYLKNNLEGLAIAYYFSELLDKLIVGPEKDERIWQMIIVCFNELNKKTTNYLLLVEIFEKKLLQYLGYDLKGEEQKPTYYIRHILGEKINSKKFINVLKY